MIDQVRVVRSLSVGGPCVWCSLDLLEIMLNLLSAGVVVLKHAISDSALSEAVKSTAFMSISRQTWVEESTGRSSITSFGAL